MKSSKSGKNCIQFQVVTMPLGSLMETATLLHQTVQKRGNQRHGGYNLVRGRRKGNQSQGQGHLCCWSHSDQQGHLGVGFWWTKWICTSRCSSGPGRCPQGSSQPGSQHL